MPVRLNARHLIGGIILPAATLASAATRPRRQPGLWQSTSIATGAFNKAGNINDSGN